MFESPNLQKQQQSSNPHEKVQTQYENIDLGMSHVDHELYCSQINKSLERQTNTLSMTIPKELTQRLQKIEHDSRVYIKVSMDESGPDKNETDAEYI